MRRREVIALLGAAAASSLLWPLPGRAQQSAGMRHIGVLIASLEVDPEGQARVAALRQGLRELDWIEGHNLKIDYRWIAADSDRISPADAAALVALKPEVIVAGPTSALAVLRPETHTIPIVFVQVTDPVGAGFVASLDHPGGNMTGFSQFEFTVAAKWVELLKEIAPSVARVAVIYDPANPTSINYVAVIDQAAKSLGVATTAFAVRSADEIQRAITTVAAEPNSGLIPLPSPLIVSQRELIIALAIRARLPHVYAFRYYVMSGALASYGVDSHDLYRRAASYVDRILKGDKPGDLPVQEATKFELVINLKAAKLLGLSIPQTLLATADEVIE
jgi:putative ABC transport system substrate-binding protein